MSQVNIAEDGDLVSCPKCNAWPMALAGPLAHWGRSTTETLFCCGRCGRREIFDLSSEESDLLKRHWPALSDDRLAGHSG